MICYGCRRDLHPDQFRKPTGFGHSQRCDACRPGWLRQREARPAPPQETKGPKHMKVGYGPLFPSSVRLVGLRPVDKETARRVGQLYFDLRSDE